MNLCLILFITVLFSINVIGAETFQLILEPRWDILNEQKITPKTGERMVLVAKITFKKKIADQINIQSMAFHWHGKSIKKLSASLYKKELGKKFMPIEKNVICDSEWNFGQQSLTFTFPKPEKLNIHSEFCLVITVQSKRLEMTLKSGYFSIDEKTLPIIMQQSQKNDTLTIAFSDLDCRKVISLH